ncbi:MAG: hypothetical protein H0W50_02940 [Parachlamydiaceae bacterium]|nr:hypothetical protein [Parachlamydiaceae bacterium]
MQVFSLYKNTKWYRFNPHLTSCYGTLKGQKNLFKRKPEEVLAQLIILFPVFKKNTAGENNLDEIIKIIEASSELYFDSLKAQENLTKQNFELLCIHWIKGSESLQTSNTEMNNNQIKSFEDKLKKILVEIQEILKASPFNTPGFAHDIKGKINEKALSMAIGNNVVIEMDDPIDILLCGTEVDGSCQRVDGDANLNKGLLGYSMDGKIKILAIKSAEGPLGKINARCLLKVL